MENIGKENLSDCSHFPPAPLDSTFNAQMLPSNLLLFDAYKIGKCIIQFVIGIMVLF